MYNFDFDYVNAEIDYENARHNMELHHIECLKMQENLKHIKSMTELTIKKTNLRKYCDCVYTPHKLTTDRNKNLPF